MWVKLIYKSDSSETSLIGSITSSESAGNNNPHCFLSDPPKLVSVSASPSNEIEEGSSVTLACKSDANPAANFTWYKDGDQSPVSNRWKLCFSSIRSSDSGEYFCAAENILGRRTSESIFVVVICEILKRNFTNSVQHFWACLTIVPCFNGSEKHRLTLFYFLCRSSLEN